MSLDMNALLWIFRHLCNVNVGLLVLPGSSILIRGCVVHAQGGFLPFHHIVYHRQHVLAPDLVVQVILAVAEPSAPLLFYVVYL